MVKSECFFFFFVFLVVRGWVVVVNEASLDVPEIDFEKLVIRYMFVRLPGLHTMSCFTSDMGWCFLSTPYPCLYVLSKTSS